jgi:hypothetical protein
MRGRWRCLCYSMQSVAGNSICRSFTDCRFTSRQFRFRFSWINYVVSFTLCACSIEQGCTHSRSTSQGRVRTFRNTFRR